MTRQYGVTSIGIGALCHHPAMRILHLVGRSHRRGAEQVALELAAELDALGHRNQLVAVSLGHEGDRVPELPALVEAPDQRPHRLPGAARRLRRQLRDDDIDVVLAHGAAAALVAAMAWPRRGPAIVWQTIVPMAPQSFGGWQRAGWRIAMRRLGAVVALTPELGEEARRLGFRGPVEPIPNARRADRFADLDRTEEGRRLRDELGVDPAVALIGIVGYLVAQKRPERAVDVLAAVRGRGVDAHLVVVGSGPLAGEVEARVAARGLADHVTLTGHRDDVPRVLAGLDVLIMTSDDEGVPGVLVEAAMAGCPAVTFPFAGAPEVIDHGVTGWIMPVADAAALGEEVAALLEGPARLAAMGAAARAGAARFSMAAVAERYVALLERVVDGAAG